MKKLIAALVILAALYVGRGQIHNAHDYAGPSAAGNGSQVVANAFGEQRSGAQVTGEGVVIKILPDDDNGSRHQRFILRLASGQTLLVAHNIELAPRLASLEPGDSVAFSGVYEWNSKGGVIHWTHHDPGGQHQAGWLKHNGEISQ